MFAATDSREDFLFIGEENYSPIAEEPFRTDTYALGFLKQGQLNLTAGLTTSIMTGPGVLTLGPHIIRSVNKVQDRPRLDLIFFKESFYLENQSDVFSLMKYSFFEEGSHFIPLSEANTGKFNSIYNLVRATISEEHPHLRTIIRSYLNILLSEIDAATAA